MLRDLQPVCQQVWGRSRAFTATLTAVTLVTFSFLVTGSHAWWHIDDGPLLVLASVVIGGALVLGLLNPFPIQWATFNYLSGQPAFSLPAPRRSDPAFKSFLDAVCRAIAEQQKAGPA